MRVSIDEKLFAHINNDAFLMGSFGLQGHIFKNTICYLEQYISSLPKESLPSDVIKMQHACSELATYADCLNELVVPQEVSLFAKAIHQQIQELKQGEYLLLPGGWRNLLAGGHAMIYQFSLDKEGNLLFSINNSGSGLNFHSKKSNQEKELYNPVLTYKIPKEKIADTQHIPAIIEQLLIPQLPRLHEKRKIDADYLYQTVFPQWSYLDGQIIHDESVTLKHWHTAGQLSGTCTQRSLHQMLKSRFSHLDDYRRFIYGFKAKALDDYIAKLKQENQFTNIRYHGQIQKAIRHQLRLLNLKNTQELTSDLFPLKFKKQEITRLTSYLSSLRTPLPQTQKIEIQKEKINASLFEWKAPKPIAYTEDHARTSLRTDLQIPKKIAGGHDLLKEMENLLERCRNLNQATQYQVLLQQLEEFFFNLPLPKQKEDPLLPYYAAIDSEEKALDFYKKINELQALYFSCCDQLIGTTVTLPRLYLMKLNIFSVIGHINNTIKISSSSTSYNDFISEVHHPISVRSPDEAYLANHSPKRDERLLQIKDLYKEPTFHHSTELVNYYQNIIDNYPHLKAILEIAYSQKYRDDHSDLHLLLREYKCTTLFYFLEHPNEFENNPDFKPLIDKFNLQKEMEITYAFYSKRTVLKDPDIKNETVSFKVCPLGFTFVEVKSPFSENKCTFNFGEAIQKNKYGLFDTSAAMALQHDITIETYLPSEKRSDNHTQLLPAEFHIKTGTFELSKEERNQIANRSIQSNDLDARELFHLRRDAQTQIPLTIDYFNEHLEKLSRHEIQVYVEANLFQPGLLLQQLKPEKRNAFFKQFDNFIENALTHFEIKNEPSLQSIALIRLAYLVNQYAAALDPISFRERIEKFYQKLTTLIEISTDENVKASLHQYRLLTSISALQYPQPNIDINEVIYSYLYSHLHTNNDEQVDTDTQFKIQCAKLDLKRILDKNKTKINSKNVLIMLSQLGIPVDLEHDRIDGRYPYFEVKGKFEYSINLEEGHIFKGNLCYGTTPLAISKHPIIQQLHLPELSTCFISPDQNTFIIEQPPLFLRFFKEGDSYQIQKGWDIGEGIQWYQLVALSPKQGTYLNLPKSSLLNSTPLPTTINERDTLAWVRTDGNELLLTNDKNQPWFRVKDTVLEQLDNHEMLTPQTTWIHQQLEDIENKNFITVTTKEGAHAVHLARYDLTFFVPQQDPTLHFNWDNSTYKYQETRYPLGPDVCCMTFARDQNEIGLFPIQEFLATGSRETTGEYHRLKQDTSARIPQAIVENILRDKEPQLWQYSHSERYFVLKMKEGKPIPQTPAEALYLCYVYLGSNQAEKAWEVLEDCNSRLGGLTGTYDEIRFLKWICQRLPHVLKDEDVDAVISTPPFVACQLKALSMLAAFSEQDKSIPFPKATSDLRTVNGIYEKHVIEETQTFYQNINSTIYKLYTRLQAMRREMPIQFTLKEAECKQLLNFYHYHLPEKKGQPKAVGALGYEWVQLQLKTLRRELSTLEAIALTRTLTSYEEKRKQDITHFITEHEGVARVYSELEYAQINLDLPDEPKINTTLLSRETKYLILYYLKPLKNLDTNIAEIPALLSQLTPNISEDVFFKNFPHYLYIATQGSETHRKQLEYYCRATLIAHRHVPLQKQETNIPLLCNALYRILCSKKPFPAIETYENLLDQVTKLTPKPIVVAQLVDKTDKLLATTQTLWQSLAEYPQKHPPTIDPAYLKDIASLSLFVGHPPIDERLFDEWRRLATQLYSGKKEGDIADSRDELTAGKTKYAALHALKQLAKTHLQERSVRQKLDASCTSRLSDLLKQQVALDQNLISLANQGPENQVLQHQWRIDIASQKRSTLDMTKLLTLYFQNDLTLYQTETGLSLEQIQRLHGMITKHVAQTLLIQQLQRIQTNLQKVQTAKNPLEEEQGLFQLAEALFSENLVDVVKEPALSLFQYYDNTLLRHQQKAALERLLTTQKEKAPTEIIEKIIMGGGKSKYIAPAFAKEKATGNNLVIIEVPRALLHTNYIDLKARSEKLFNQTAVLFDFNRDNDCSPKRLEQLYNKFIEIIVNKNYLVNTGDSLQSLELKYLELLSKPPKIHDNSETSQEILKTWEKQIYWLDKLVLLLRHRGDLLIDEVHQGLLLKNKLNYTVDEPGSVPQSILKNTLKLYQFFKYVPINHIAGLDDKQQFTLQDVVKNNKLLTEPHYFDAACKELAKQLVHHPASPINKIIQELKRTYGDITKVLETYLLDQGKEIPEFILKADHATKEFLALCKEQINHLLPFTLKRNHGEHYGPSKRANRSPELRAISIPYVANNVPNERSQFGNYLETLNYTIQSLQIAGISKDLMHHVLENFLIQARKEMHEQHIKAIDSTPTAGIFNELAEKTGLHLSTLNLDNEDQLNLLHQSLSHNEILICEILDTDILRRIRADSEILHSDAYNHVDMVHSCHGMTGTPWNHSTFHERLKYDANTAIGTDGYIISGLQAKHPRIRGIDFHDVDSFIEDLFSAYQANDVVRTILDISATFQGIDNIRVAKSIAHALLKHPEKFSIPEKIKYVLYFNEENELSALSLSDNLENPNPIKIGSSDPEIIQDRLGVGPESYFTFYDQSHTLGIDIKQLPNAKGITLIDRNTTLSNFRQGAMRMRGLIEQNQTIDIITPRSLGCHDFDSLIPLLERQEQEQLKLDNYDAARQRMRNTIRNDLLNRILTSQGKDSAQEKHRLFTVFKPHFIDQRIEDFFAQYGEITQEEDTLSLLTYFQNQLITDWKRVVQKAGFELSDTEENILNEKLKTIIQYASKPGMCHPVQRSRNVQTDIEVETQKEVQIEVEKEIQKETYDPFKTEEPYLSISRMVSNLPPSEHIFFTKEISDFKRLSGMKTLTEICETTNARNVPHFNPHILATKNFYKTYQEQTNFLGAYAKPVHALLFIKDGNDLHCVLLTQQECQEIVPIINARQDHAIWISTTQHTVLAGHPPDAIQNENEYQAILEQVCYFNGEFELFLERHYQLGWLTEQSKEKLEFFTRYLQPSRETPSTQIQQLDTLLSQKIKAFLFIANNPDVDRTQFDWKAHFPDIADEDIEELQTLSNAFHVLTESWWDRDLKQTQWQDAFTLSLWGRGYLRQYTAKLDAIKEIINILKPISQKTAPDSSLVTSISTIIPPRLLEFFPAVSFLTDIPSAKQNYLFLLNLLRNTPASTNTARFELINIISKNNYIEAEIVDDLVKYVEQSANIAEKQELIFNLLSNPSENITPAIFQILYAHARDEKCMLALSKHRFLKETDFIPLLEKAANFPNIQESILLNLVSRQDVSSLMLKLIIEQRELTFRHIQSILEKELDHELLTLLLEKTKNVSELKHVVMNHNFKNVDIATLNKLVKENTDLYILKEIVKNPAATSVLLESIIEKSHDTTLLQEILKRDLLLTPSLLQKIITIPDVSSDVLLSILPKTEDKELLSMIDAHPNANYKVKEALISNRFIIEKTFYELLDTLKNKTTQLINKGTKGHEQYDSKYVTVATTAKALIETLEKAGTTFFDSNTRITTEDIASFKISCERAITKAETEFSKHRDIWFQLAPILRGILGLLATITVIPAIAVGFASKYGYRGTFFEKPPTDSSKKLRAFKTKLQTNVMEPVSKSSTQSKK